jgi:proline iminopeptidase
MLRPVAVLALLFVVAGAKAADTRHDVVVDGVRLAYWSSRTIASDDVPVLFLHGGPGYNQYSFRMSAGARLAEHLPMVYLDQRGSGASERPLDGDYSMSRLVDDVEGVRSHLGAGKITLIGHSFGGTVAAEYAAAHPHRVEKLVLLNAAVDLPAAMASWVGTLEQRYPQVHAQTLASPVGQALRTAEQGDDDCVKSRARMAFVGAAQQQLPDSQAFHDGQQFHRMQALAEQRRLDAEGGLRNTGEIGGYVFSDASTFPCYRVAAPARLAMPTLVAVGAFDRAVGVDPQRALVVRLPDARLHVFEHSAHFPYHEEPEAFETVLLEFLSAR